MSSKKIRVGVIGTGFGSEVHIPGFQQTPETEVVAVCSVPRKRAEEAKREFGIPHAYDNYRELLKRDDIDLVSIVTPVYLHRQMVFDALDAGKHVLCEKAFAMNLKEAREMYQKAKASKKVTMINHELRHVPTWARMKELVDEGYLGQLRHVIITQFWGDNRDPATVRPWTWVFDKAQGGGFWQAMGVHYIDALRYWFGEIEGVYGQFDTLIKERPDPESGQLRKVTADDCHAYLFRMENGVLGCVFVTVSIRFGSGFRVEAYGSEGTLVLERDVSLKGGRAGDEALKEIPIPKRLAPPPAEGHVRLMPFKLLVRDLVKAIREGTEMHPNFYDGLKHMEVIEALRKSFAEGRWVTLDEIR